MEPRLDETACEFVSSRGILKCCDIHTPTPKSSSDFLDPSIYSTIPAGSTVYVCTEAIPNFLKTYLPQAKGPIVVVSGDSDLTFPTKLDFLEDPKILHWFAQNSTGTHAKLSSIPIGLDYHTVADQDHHWSPKTSPVDQESLLKSLASIEPSLSRRAQKAYGNYLLNISRGDRREAFEKIPKEVMLYEKGFVMRSITWWKQASAAFTISPHGNGLDCHRTWETLVLGGVPIVKSSPLDCLYEGLPVWIVNSWADVSEKSIEETIARFEKKSFDLERLKLKYWVSKIKDKAK